VYVTISESEENIQVEANDNLHEHIDIRLDGNKLRIKLMDVRKIRGNETLNVFITTKNITDFRAEGNSKLVLENTLEVPTVRLNITGNSWFTGAVTTGSMELNATGNSMISMKGSTNVLNAVLKGNCELSDYDLSVQSLQIDMAGNSNAYLTVSGSIDIVAKGNSVLSYDGNASIIRQDLSSDSKIIRR
jgi:hypothetical protein